MPHISEGGGSGTREPSRSRSRPTEKKKRKKKKKETSSSSSESSSSSSEELLKKHRKKKKKSKKKEDDDDNAEVEVKATTEVEIAKAAALDKLLKVKKTPKENRLADWRALLREYHPDKNPDNVEVATAVFQFLQKGRKLIMEDE